MDNTFRRPLAHLTDGILLLLALQVTVWGAVTAYGIGVEATRLTVTVSLLALGSLLIFALPDRARHLAVPAVLALWALRLWQSWERLGWGAARVWCDLVNTLAREMPGPWPWPWGGCLAGGGRAWGWSCSPCCPCSPPF